MSSPAKPTTTSPKAAVSPRKLYQESTDVAHRSPIQLKLVNTSKQQVVERDGVHYLVWQISATDETGAIREVQLSKEISDADAYIHRLPELEFDADKWSDMIIEALHKDLISFVEGNCTAFQILEDKRGHKAVYWERDLGTMPQYMNETGNDDCCDWAKRWRQDGYDNDQFHAYHNCNFRLGFIVEKNIHQNFNHLNQDRYVRDIEVITAYADGVLTVIEASNDFDDIKEAFIAKAREVFNMSE